MPRYRIGPLRPDKKSAPIRRDSDSPECDVSAEVEKAGGPFEFLFPPYFVLEEEVNDPYDSDGQPIDYEAKKYAAYIKTRDRENRGDYVPVKKNERESLEPVKDLVYLGYAEDWKLPRFDADEDDRQRFTSPPVFPSGFDYPERVIQADGDGNIKQPPLTPYDDLPQILSIKKVQYNLHELDPPLSGILLDSEKSALYHFWRLLADSVRKRFEEALKCPVCGEGARFGTEIILTAISDEQKPTLPSQHVMSSHVFNELAYSTLDQDDDITDMNLTATDPLEWVLSKTRKLHAIEDAYWKEELLGKECPGKREFRNRIRRNLAGDYRNFNVRKDREEKRNTFRKRVAAAAGITNPNLRKRRKTVRAFDAQGKGVGKGQYIRKRKRAANLDDQGDDGDFVKTEELIPELDLYGDETDGSDDSDGEDEDNYDQMDGGDDDEDDEDDADDDDGDDRMADESGNSSGLFIST